MQKICISILKDCHMTTTNDLNEIELQKPSNGLML